MLETDQAIKVSASFPQKDQCFNNTSSIYFKNYLLRCLYLVHHDSTHIARSPHNNIEIREQVGRIQKLAPNQAIVKCWSLELNPGVSASEIWAYFIDTYVYCLI